MSFLFDQEPTTVTAGFVPFKVDFNAFAFGIELANTLPLGKAADLSCLPFDKTWFEIQTDTGKCVLKVKQVDAAGLRREFDLAAYNRWDVFKRGFVIELRRERGHIATVVVIEDASEFISTASAEFPDNERRHDTLTKLYGLCLLLNSSEVIEREHVDMEKIDRKRRARGTGVAHSFTRLKLTPVARDWYLHKQQPIYKDERGQHWVRRHPSIYWTKQDGRQTPVIMFRGPFKRGNPEYGEREARYVVR